MNKYSEQNRPFYDEVLAGCSRIVATSGELAEARMATSAYVLPGMSYQIHTSTGVFRFWLGINGPRLFFIVYVKGIDADRAREAFSFCFGGAKKVGWEVNYEPLDNGVSVWATCMTDRSIPMLEKSLHNTRGVNRDPVLFLAEYGQFWATDIAMMVQSWVRTSERLGIECHDKEPAPL